MRFLMSIFLLFIPVISFSQRVYSESTFDYKKPFAPYEIQNVIGLGNNEFVILQEHQKSSFTLQRLDEYFIDKWSKLIDYKNVGSFPRLLRVGQEIIIYRYWTDNNKAFVEIKKYHIETGELITEEKKVIWESQNDLPHLKVKFSPTAAHFLVYDASPGPSNNKAIDIYDTSTLEKKGSKTLTSDPGFKNLTEIYLSDALEIFLAVGNAGTYTMDVYYFGNNGSQPIKLTSNFTFNRPADEFSSISIVQQSESTYLVQTTANIEDEIVGINISSFNVVLKSLLLSNTFNVDNDFIKNAYQGSLFTSESQKKKFITTPQKLSGFSFQELFLDNNGNITSIFENQELPSTYHSIESGLNFNLKWKEPEEKNYVAEDLLLININSEGEIIWTKVIQKSQVSQGHGLTLSYLSRPSPDDELELVMKESAKGNSIYRFSIDLTNGNIISKLGFMDQKIEINKNYCTWVNEKTLLLCGNKPGSNKRNFYMVEF